MAAIEDSDEDVKVDTECWLELLEYSAGVAFAATIDGFRTNGIVDELCGRASGRRRRERKFGTKPKQAIARRTAESDGDGVGRKQARIPNAIISP